jgi:hypothetical protein
MLLAPHDDILPTSLESWLEKDATENVRSASPAADVCVVTWCQSWLPAYAAAIPRWQCGREQQC